MTNAVKTIFEPGTTNWNRGLDSNWDFAELLGYKNTVFLICLGFTQNIQDAEDLAQDSYVKAYLNMDSLKKKESKKGWLLKITRNTCLDYARKKKNPVNSPLDIDDWAKTTNMADWKTPEFLAVHGQQFQLLQAAITKLPTKLKDTFVMKEYADLSYKEIAQTLNIRQGTVMSRLSRARKILTETMRSQNHG